jgi:hypothetical protein
MAEENENIIGCGVIYPPLLSFTIAFACLLFLLLLQHKTPPTMAAIPKMHPIAIPAYTPTGVVVVE